MTVDQFIVLTTFLGLPFAMGEEELKPLLDTEDLPEGIMEYLQGKAVYNLEPANIMQQMRQDEEFRSMMFEEIKEFTGEVNPYLVSRYRGNLSKNWGLELDSNDRMSQVLSDWQTSRLMIYPKK
jgi:hypothetical protein